MIAAVTPDVLLAVLPAMAPVAVGVLTVMKHTLKRVHEHEHQLGEVQRRLQSHTDHIGLILDATAAIYGTVNQITGKTRPRQEWVEYDPILAAGADIVPEFEQKIVGWMSASGAERISRDTVSWYGWDAIFELGSAVPVAWVPDHGNPGEEPQPIFETVLRWRKCKVEDGETWLPAPTDLTKL